MNTTTSTCQIYHLRNINGMAWADIFIKEGDHSGTLIIRSDYGSYDFYWGSCGRPFKEFLCGLNDGYLMNKLSYGKQDHWDTDKFIERCREKLDEKLKENEISKEEYDNANKNLGDLERQGTRTQEGTQIYVMCELDALRKCLAYEEMPSVNEPDPLLVMFIERIWHPFVNEVLKNEIPQTA